MKTVLIIIFGPLLAFMLVHDLPRSLAADKSPQSAPTHVKRRALLVGISRYESSRFPKLEYPPNDVASLAELLESPSYGFTVTRLTDDTSEKPTRENILKAIQKVLIDDATPGDISLFYFSGHGSSVKNSLSDEADHRDETIVPIDAVRPVTGLGELKDIRDKEIAELFNRALDKGIKLTGIFDSCHSGSIARGDEQAKEVEEVDFDIKSAPTDAQKIKPEDRGALIITAAEDYQQAGGGTYQLNGREAKYSHLTAELLQSLYEEPASRISARDLYRRVAARLTAAGRSQTPTIAGIANRMDGDLFGDARPLEGKIRVPITIDRENGRDTVLAGGIADGLTDGVELRRIDPVTGRENDPTLRIRIKKAGLSLSEFEIVHGPQKSSSSPTPNDNIKVGDIFEQASWVLKKEPNVTVWIPPALPSESDLTKELSALAKNNIQLLSEPEPAEQNVVYTTSTANGVQWHIRLQNGTIAPLGKDLRAAQVLSVFAKYKSQKPKLFVDIPPSVELRKTIKANLADQDSSTIITEKREAANYILAGRYNSETNALEYAWTLPSQLYSSNAKSKDLSLKSLPPLTDWVTAQPNRTAAGELTTLALKLGKISGWLKLRSPIDVGSLEFPYKLEIRKHGNGTEAKALAFGQPMFANEEYELVLVGDPSKLKNNNVILPEFWVYVMNIDGTGKGSYINTGVSEKYGGMSSFDAQNPPREIPILNKEGKPFEVYSPYGTEVFILLIADRPIDRSLLTFNGVRDQSVEGRGAFNPLENLLRGVGVDLNARGYLSSPDTWAIQQLIMTSADHRQ